MPKARDILQDDPRGLRLSDHANDIWPEPSIIRGPPAQACATNRGTGEPGCNGINLPSPLTAGKGSDATRENRCRIQRSLFHAAEKYLATVGFPFHVNDDAASWKSRGAGKVKSTDSGEEAENSSRGMSHTYPSRDTRSKGPTRLRTRKLSDPLNDGSRDQRIREKSTFHPP